MIFKQNLSYYFTNVFFGGKLLWGLKTNVQKSTKMGKFAAMLKNNMHICGRIYVSTWRQADQCGKSSSNFEKKKCISMKKCLLTKKIKQLCSKHTSKWAKTHCCAKHALMWEKCSKKTEKYDSVANLKWILNLFVIFLFIFFCNYLHWGSFHRA